MFWFLVFLKLRFNDKHLFSSIVVPYKMYELYTIGKKFGNFTELYNELGTLWNFTNFTFCNLSALYS